MAKQGPPLMQPGGTDKWDHQGPLWRSSYTSSKHIVEKLHGTSAPIFSRSVSGNAGTERRFAFPPLSTPLPLV